jgi:TetR/AcrR family transcriptional repressor of nem operon
MGGETRERILEVGQRLAAVKGFTAVGLNEILATAGVPKGSFYHYFASKEQYGTSLVDHYVQRYLEGTEEMLRISPLPARDRLLNLWQRWHQIQSGDDEGSKCLIVKLSAEVADFSGEMRIALWAGVYRFIARLAQCIEEGQADGSLPASLDAAKTAQTLYQLWLGASMLAKLSRSRMELDSAMETTREILGIL